MLECSLKRYTLTTSAGGKHFGSHEQAHDELQSLHPRVEISKRWKGVYTQHVAMTSRRTYGAAICKAHAQKNRADLVLFQAYFPHFAWPNADVFVNGASTYTLPRPKMIPQSKLRAVRSSHELVRNEAAYLFSRAFPKRRTYRHVCDNLSNMVPNWLVIEPSCRCSLGFTAPYRMSSSVVIGQRA